MSKIKKIGVFTSGGDSPGMNACIRAVVRTALFHKMEVCGIIRGYEGMIENDFITLHSRSVSNIIHRGGTILKSARSEEFKTEAGRKKANENLKAHGVDALVAIGGDGTFRGFTEFSKINPDIKAIGIPGTIDNDLTGTDFTLGFDTAVNTVIDAIDKLRDTADSHHRLFFIEVMGRDSGCIALWSGVAGGAEAILLPEKEATVDELIALLQEGADKKKSSSIVIISEHNRLGSAHEIAKKVTERFNYYDTRVTVLGHVQRGGSPTVFDRILGTKLGVRAVELLLEGETNKMVGIMNNKISLTDFSNATKQQSPLDEDLLRMRSILTI